MDKSKKGDQLKVTGSIKISQSAEDSIMIESSLYLNQKYFLSGDEEKPESQLCIFVDSSINMGVDNILVIIREQIIALSIDPKCVVKIFMFSDTDATIVNNDPQDAPGKFTIKLVIN